MSAGMVRATLLVLAIVGSCGDGGDGGPPADVAGHWTGDWQSTSADVSGSLAVDLTQAGSQITGLIQLGDSPCGTDAWISGLVSGNALRFSAVDGPQATSFAAQIEEANGGSVRGSYHVTDGNCAGDAGKFNLTRTAP